MPMKKDGEGRLWRKLCLYGSVACLAMIAPGLLFEMASISAQRGTPPSLMIDNAVSGWIAEHSGSNRVSVAEKELTITERAGWVRTEQPSFGDFRLRFDARLTGQSTRAVVTIFGHGSSSEAVTRGFALPVIDDRAPSAKAIGKGSLMFFRPNAGVVADALRPTGEWQSYEVVRVFRDLSMTVNGRTVLSAIVPRMQDGWIAFRTEGGSITLRNIEVVRTAGLRSEPTPMPGVVGPGGDVVLPKVIQEATPKYTGPAMRARIEGDVWLDCVVQLNGQCTDIQIALSLDPVLGLDLAAIDSVGQWRFVPGMRSGQPVPVLVTISTTFRLR